MASSPFSINTPSKPSLPQYDIFQHLNIPSHLFMSWRRILYSTFGCACYRVDSFVIEPELHRILIIQKKQNNPHLNINSAKSGTLVSDFCYIQSQIRYSSARTLSYFQHQWKTITKRFSKTFHWYLPDIGFPFLSAFQIMQTKKHTSIQWL